MSDIEKSVPPVGEEIHLPDGSIQPLLLTIGVTVALVGVTFHPAIVSTLGGLLTLATLFRWISDARKEMDALPAHHGDEH